MNTPNDGGPAFPGEQGQDGYGNCKMFTNPAGGISWINLNQGMTLRDYFAAKAMAAICAHPDTWGLIVQDIVAKAYKIADAMLAARETKQ